MKAAGAPGVGWEGLSVAITLNFTPNHTCSLGFFLSSQAALESREVGTGASIILSAQHPCLLPCSYHRQRVSGL